MRRSIFYSWQSDLDAALTRNFIEDALKDAVKKIGRDDQILVEPVLDRDTAGLSGAPGISEAIFRKIARSDIFVADVSIITPHLPLYGFHGRPAPNPNVLVELGYAITHLGWDRILLIQNLAFGAPEVLPFDLRGRRAVGYTLKRKQDRVELRSDFRDRVADALRLAFKDMSGPLASNKGNEPRWWGRWEVQVNGKGAGGTLFIREVSGTGFLFNLMTFHGSHLGQIDGVARFVGPYSAYAAVRAMGQDKFCELGFRRVPEYQREIMLDVSSECREFGGMRAFFQGVYKRKFDPLFDYGFLDELDLARLYWITGQYFEPMMDRFQEVGSDDNKEMFPARVIRGGVAGLYTIMEGIIVRGEQGQLWAAYIDHEKVRYFTSEREYKQKLPITIEQWRQRFKDQPVIFDSPVEVIGEMGWGGKVDR